METFADAERFNSGAGGIDTGTGNCDLNLIDPHSSPYVFNANEGGRAPDCWKHTRDHIHGMKQKVAIQRERSFSNS